MKGYKKEKQKKQKSYNDPENSVRERSSVYWCLKKKGRQFDQKLSLWKQNRLEKSILMMF